ncbi:RNA polymerase sigma factor [Gilvimarinus polysaccharolyticus]|uniref:RNA polymerase sigma factor n=1 Tax=Gilvimarinus polysaccharolyticus TaxID=863921 RepID=UPI000673A92A|nr:RNA polymerase sigma factor [Gilvimarinus polysaccharolyticus]
MDPDNLSQLIQRAQAGEADAFSELLEAHYELIYRFAFRWCAKREAAEDITQQCCIKLAGAIKQFQHRSKFSTWLYRLVINTAHDWQRHEGRHHQTDTSCDQPVAATAQDESAIYLQQVLKQLDVMGEGLRETALLVLAEGFNHREAAEILGVKESTISWRLHHMRKQLASTDGAHTS